jgi:hypothetical protein
MFYQITKEKHIMQTETTIQKCESCQTVGIDTPATTKRNGENVCDDCAAEIDSRAQEQAELRESAYDDRGIRRNELMFLVSNN